ncbi:hypothetical protein CF088_12475 [Clostridium botulinum]|uniref:hypothetical protein n=2 Tax=Clostridium botulinum TaxID=1491 RepID=UPI0007744802|nr:hypothetical protein [Clostridium botulinum]APH21139.1 adenosine/AMP deaminase family protein [Clostridium botulinum]APQ69586.1 adenosine/AMP deaminase family protein [Clostridium botulinum]MBN3379480.1 hypothetical protein [Clostridium botulinum]MBN3406084.1 hypothetical protein [Clostridium botulinum]OSA74587.1 hypothetical protein B2H86_10420 [Clostridium botulinum]
MLNGKMSLRIKLLTLPFSEIKFYDHDYIDDLAKYKDNKSYEKKCFGKCLKNIYSIINIKNNIYNLDEINLLMRSFYDKDEMDEYFKKNNNISDFYLAHLSKLSKIFLSHRNGKISLKYWKTKDEEDILGPYSGIYKIALWNLLNRKFTIDLLVLLYLLDNGMEDEYYLSGYHSLVVLDDLQLEQILNKGVAETHLHLKAGINFILSWQDLMCLKEEKYKNKEISFYDQIIGRNIGLENYVKAIAILRIVMSLFLREKTDKKFSLYVIENFKELNDLNKLIESLYNGENLLEKKFSYKSIYEELKMEKDIKQIGSPRTGSWSEDLAQKDIIYSILNLNISEDYSTVENIFLFRCLKHIKKSSNDLYFSKLFWQYIRVKNEVFQLKIQGNGIKGLEYFKNFYHRSTTTNYSNKETIGLVIHTQLENSNLKKLELRSGIGDEKNWKNIADNMRKDLIVFFQAYSEIGKNIKDRDIPAIGLIYHFIKEKDLNSIEKCWLDYKEEGKIYFKTIQDRYIRQVKALNYVRENVNGISDYIVGIDAASSENDTEPWVFAPVYEKARNSDTHKIIYKNNPHKRIRNLGFTFHVGEDFRHILTGLRRIDEVIEHFKFHAGDRIGHAIALGIEVDKWAIKNKVIILPRIEYLENLLWVWGIHKAGEKIEYLDASYLEKKIFVQAEKIYKHMEGITVFNLWKAYQSKFKVFSKSNEFNENSSEKNNAINKLFCWRVKNEYAQMWNTEKLVHAQHCKCYLKFMLEPIQINITDEEIKIIKYIQKIMLKKVGSKGIVVETNPTSNTAIGQIENIFQHYILNLNHHGLKDIEQCNDLMVTINTDDPSVFNTNINNEFAYIFYSLKEKGYNTSQILYWIDQVREVGLNSSFIETRTLNNDKRLEELYEIIEGLENLEILDDV